MDESAELLSSPPATALYRLATTSPRPRGRTIEPVEVHCPVAGSSISADAVTPPALLVPPARRTEPSSNRTAAAKVRKSLNGPVGVHEPGSTTVKLHGRDPHIDVAPALVETVIVCEPSGAFGAVEIAKT